METEMETKMETEMETEMEKERKKRERERKRKKQERRQKRKKIEKKQREERENREKKEKLKVQSKKEIEDMLEKQKIAVDNAREDEFVVENDFVQVYTDGSYVYKDRAGLGVWWNHGHKMNVSKRIFASEALARGGPSYAELEAVFCALEQILSSTSTIKKVQINSDSEDVLNLMDNWKTHAWKKTDGEEIYDDCFALKDVQKLSHLIAAVNYCGIEIKWNQVKGHVGIVGNVGADMLAKEGCFSS